MSELRFTVPGSPVPKQRARLGRGGHWYTPQPTRDYEQAVGAHAMVSRIRRRWERADAQSRFVVTVDAFLPDAHTRDIDNIGKSVLDALNRNIWRDDRQVVRLVINRHVDRASPRTEVTIARLEQATPDARRLQ